MKSNDFLSEGFVEDANDVHADHEVQMARADLFHAAENALALHKLLRHVSEQSGLEGWVSAKITLAADYLNTVREHMEYQLMSGVQEPTNVIAVAEDQSTNESLADEFMAMARAKGMNPRLRGTPDEERARTDAMLKQRAVDRTNAPKPAAVGDEERANLEARLKELEAKFDPNYEYSDDHSFWTQQKGIAQQIGVIKQKLSQGVAEGLPKNDKDEFKRQALLVKDRKTGKLYDPNKEFDKKMKSPEVMAQMKRMAAKEGVAEAGEWTKLPNGNWRNMHTGAQQSTPPKTKKPRKTMGLNASLEQHADDKMKELGHKFKSVSEMSAGSVAGVVNPPAKNKAKVGTLFGGTYKQKKAK